MSKASRMTVVKRDGREEVVHFDKITSRIEKLCYGLDMDYIDPTQITVKVINDHQHQLCIFVINTFIIINDEQVHL